MTTEEVYSNMPNPDMNMKTSPILPDTCVALGVTQDQLEQLGYYHFDEDEKYDSFSLRNNGDGYDLIANYNTRFNPGYSDGKGWEDSESVTLVERMSEENASGLLEYVTR